MLKRIDAVVDSIERLEQQGGYSLTPDADAALDELIQEVRKPRRATRTRLRLVHSS